VKGGLVVREPLMTHGGSIILVSSAIHVMGIPGHTTYAATKAALRSYARTWLRN
jgi:short-subunit dehydrogenase